MALLTLSVTLATKALSPASLPFGSITRRAISRLVPWPLSLRNSRGTLVPLEDVDVLALRRNVAQITAIAEQHKHGVNVVDLGAYCFRLGFAGRESVARQFGALRD